jgi:8-oxo-dGTP pyrophosphatase MutT (NUDIX family)
MHPVAMGSAVRDFPDQRLITVSTRGRSYRSSPGAVRVSQLSKLPKCEQVAAVCYRFRNGAVEFLLVQTRGSGRWTFPKGSAEPGLTHAQAAAMEAFEEAGVHGRIEESAFVRYICSKPGSRASSKGSAGFAVSAHLCEVRRLSKPKEANRNRTWFSVKETKFQLREGREEVDGATFARVVDRAVARIRKLLREENLITDTSESTRTHVNSIRNDIGNSIRGNEDWKDPLRRVHLEACYSINDQMVRSRLAPRLVSARRIADESESGLQFVELPSRNLSLLTRAPKKLKA